METQAEQQNASGNIAGPMLPIEQEVARGLRFAHIMLQAIERQGDEALGLVEELNRLLAAREHPRGLRQPELERKRQFATAVVQ